MAEAWEVEETVSVGDCADCCEGAGGACTCLVTKAAAGEFSADVTDDGSCTGNAGTALAVPCATTGGTPFTINGVSGYQLNFACFTDAGVDYFQFSLVTGIFVCNNSGTNTTFDCPVWDHTFVLLHGLTVRFYLT